MKKLLLAGLALLLALPAAAVERRPLVVEGGEVSGVYYPEAGAVCRLVDKDQARHGLRCLIEPTSGSAANLASLRSGEAQLAIVQSRMMAEAVAGTGAYDKQPFPELRSLFSLHGEAVAVLLAPSAKIKSLADLKGKRVNVGRPGSFQRSMADAVLGAAGVKPGELAAAQEMDMPHQIKALCGGELDAAIVSGLHPIPEVQEAMDDCNATLLPLKDATLDAWLKNNPAFSRMTIAADDYQGLKEKLPTIGLRAVVATTSALSADDAYAVVKAVFDNLPTLKAQHPMLAGLEKKQMARDSLAAPLHEGAQRYYRENGLP